LVEEMITQFDEIFHDKNLKVNYQLDEKEIYASPYLTEVLLSNLISNAIRHNYKNGEIVINLSAGSLVVQNTGNEPELNDEKIFARFQKSSGSEGSGLGLTISKQICENFGFSLKYSFDGVYHTFKVEF
jgi:signal transduction histidine kinase